LAHVSHLPTHAKHRRRAYLLGSHHAWQAVLGYFLPAQQAAFKLKRKSTLSADNKGYSLFLNVIKLLSAMVFVLNYLKIRTNCLLNPT
jgi:hypothetical protein